MKKAAKKASEPKVTLACAAKHLDKKLQAMEHALLNDSTFYKQSVEGFNRLAVQTLQSVSNARLVLARLCAPESKYPVRFYVDDRPFELVGDVKWRKLPIGATPRETSFAFVVTKPRALDCAIEVSQLAFDRYLGLRFIAAVPEAKSFSVTIKWRGWVDDTELIFDNPVDAIDAFRENINKPNFVEGKITHGKFVFLKKQGSGLAENISKSFISAHNIAFKP